MKVLLDEGVPNPLTRYLPGHEVSTVVQQGWAAFKNGKLLRLIEGESFSAFITSDKNMHFQQQLTNRPFAILILSNNHWPTMKRHASSVAKALEFAIPGTVTQVECGTFSAAKFKDS